MKFINRANTRPRLLAWLERSPLLSEDFLFGSAAILVGLASGAGIWLFKQGILWAEHFFYGAAASWLAGLGGWTVALIPAFAGLIVGLLAQYWIGAERHPGVAGIMASVALAGGRLRYWRMPVKALAAALSIGGGATVGPEDPSVQIGANVGSFLGQRWRLSAGRTRSLVAAGAAGGIAAAFNAPIAGVFFAVEIVIGEISGSALGSVVLSAVASSVFTQAVSGSNPAFSVPAYAYRSPVELPFYLGLGILAGGLSAAYIVLIDRIKALCARVRLPAPAKTVLAGLLVGLVSLALPQVRGVGYGTIETIFSPEAVSSLLLVAVLLARLVLTPVSLGGGFHGGVFAPSMVLGAALGGIYSEVIDTLMPAMALPRPAFAMVGMAAVLAGAVRAPLTATLLLFEMTNDYRIILPLMLAVMVSLLVSQRLQKDSVYTLALARLGIRLRRGRDIEVLQGITVAEVMSARPPVLRLSMPLPEAQKLLWKSHQRSLPVVDEHGRLAGILSLRDLEAAAHAENWLSLHAGDVCSREVEVTTPGATIGEALRQMSLHDIAQIPVVDPLDHSRLVGMLSRGDVVRAYDLALVRHAAARQREQEVSLDLSTGMDVVELQVQAGSTCAGRLMREIAWPAESLITSVRRGRETIIPRGDTRLESGDVLVAMASEQVRQQLQALTGGETGDLGD